jgi:hypothetical protein
MRIGAGQQVVGDGLPVRRYRNCWELKKKRAIIEDLGGRIYSESRLTQLPTFLNPDINLLLVPIDNVPRSASSLGITLRKQLYGHWLSLANSEPDCIRNLEPKFGSRGIIIDQLHPRRTEIALQKWEIR